ncbi:unnamed protein product [Phytomonas sp. Hart1]|nr:unnamed protein product [Phytomonas sp. Hart1]|eukprot:CCW68339.1 unnamed protein product [Phytomonas sp. isolate Hart1]
MLDSESFRVFFLNILRKENIGSSFVSAVLKKDFPMMFFRSSKLYTFIQIGYLKAIESSISEVYLYSATIHHRIASCKLKYYILNVMVFSWLLYCFISPPS